jgi:hypothetical protein
MAEKIATPPPEFDLSAAVPVDIDHAVSSTSTAIIKAEKGRRIATILGNGNADDFDFKAYEGSYKGTRLLYSFLLCVDAGYNAEARLQS